MSQPIAITQDELSAALDAVFREWGTHENLPTNELAEKIFDYLVVQRETARLPEDAR